MLESYDSRRAEECTRHQVVSPKEQDESDLFAESLALGHESVAKNAHLMLACVDTAALDADLGARCCGLEGHPPCSADGGGGDCPLNEGAP